ncbi:MAG: S41 family peptidase [Bacteroidaceae bacterium]|nr:S41 family peptidase [Bacteroidaceae bacterium]
MKRLLNRIWQLAVGLVISLCLGSCFDMPEATDTPEGNLKALWQIIDEHYCFLDYKHVNWDEVRSRYFKKLNPKMTQQQLMEVMAAMLSELKDGHVNLYTSYDVARYWHWYEDYPRCLDEGLRQQYLGSDYKIAAGLKYRILDDNVGYLVYESFASPIGEGNISDALYLMRSCNGLIVDVRGNSGGLLTNAEQLASHFTNERRHVGYVTYKTGPGHNDFATPMAEYLDPSTGYRWQKPVVVLTNRECYSACNIFVRDMKELPDVTILGDQTGGGSGMPFSAELPNGWAVRFSASPSFDAKMQQIEFGIEPDERCLLDSAVALQGRDSMIERARTLLNQP